MVGLSIRYLRAAIVKTLLKKITDSLERNGKAEA
jgi:hypothetical protein